MYILGSYAEILHLYSKVVKEFQKIVWLEKFMNYSNTQSDNELYHEIYKSIS